MHSSEGFPWALFDALNGEAAADNVLQRCPRMRDVFSQYWVEQYPTKEELGGEDSRSCLATLGSEMRDSTHRVEVRHGQFQREMKEKSLHVTPTDFAFISAIFLMQRTRGIAT